MSQQQGYQCSTAGDVVAWRSDHTGSSRITATNSLADNEHGLLSSGTSVHLYIKCTELFF